ncbi:MAG: hypothetical protein IPN13_11015 [Bacteroidetes bacterium]|nr:hypothetical protein [Bacteroidota bacterium]MBK9048591.1 hypothetical protein [Bacteroidota bacterium]
MKKSNTILKSLLITVIYFVTANIYLFGGFTNPISESSFRKIFEAIFTFPAIIIFGVGFGSGSVWGYFAALLIFIIIWLLIWGLTYAYYSVKKENGKRKPTL